MKRKVRPVWTLEQATQVRIALATSLDDPEMWRHVPDSEEACARRALKELDQAIKAARSPGGAE